MYTRTDIHTYIYTYACVCVFACSSDIYIHTCVSLSLSLSLCSLDGEPSVRTSKKPFKPRSWDPLIRVHVRFRTLFSILWCVF